MRSRSELVNQMNVVVTTPQWTTFMEYLEHNLTEEQTLIETTKSVEELYRAQGSIKQIRKLLNLRKSLTRIRRETK